MFTEKSMYVIQATLLKPTNIHGQCTENNSLKSFMYTDLIYKELCSFCFLLCHLLQFNSLSKFFAKGQVGLKCP